MRTVLAIIFLALFLISNFFTLGVLWLVGKIIGPEKAELAELRIVQVAFRCEMFIFGLKMDVKGLEKVPRDEPVLYVANHRSIMDIVTTYSLAPTRTGYISKDTIDRVPILGLVMRRIHCLFIYRDDMKQSLKVILKAIEYVKSGVSIAIFPEGTRCKDPDPTAMGPFKEGSFKIALKSGCKIVPIAIIGTADIYENHKPWVKKGKVSITYGDPIDVTKMDKEEQKHIGEYCHDVIQGMLVDMVNAKSE